jgi:hypothetical protein
MAIVSSCTTLVRYNPINKCAHQSTYLSFVQITQTVLKLFVATGHGTKIRDDDSGEEGDGYDEALCPRDFQSAGMIRDDDLFEILVKPLADGVHMVSLMDCCHSGMLEVMYMLLDIVMSTANKYCYYFIPSCRINHGSPLHIQRRRKRN